MNGGYVIVRDDLATKITIGTVQYKGAYKYAKQLYETGKVILLRIDDGQGFVVTSVVSSIKQGTDTFTWIVFADPTLSIAFNKNTPDQITIGPVGNNGG